MESSKQTEPEEKPKEKEQGGNASLQVSAAEIDAEKKDKAPEFREEQPYMSFDGHPLINIKRWEPHKSVEGSNYISFDGSPLRITPPKASTKNVQTLSEWSGYISIQGHILADNIKPNMNNAQCKEETSSYMSIYGTPLSKQLRASKKNVQCIQENSCYMSIHGYVLPNRSTSNRVNDESTNYGKYLSVGGTELPHIKRIKKHSVLRLPRSARSVKISKSTKHLRLVKSAKSSKSAK